MVTHVYPEQARIAIVSRRDHVQFVDAPSGAVIVPVVQLVQAMGLLQECQDGQWARQIETAVETVRGQLAFLTESPNVGKSNVIALREAFDKASPDTVAELRRRGEQVLERRLKRLEGMLKVLRKLDLT